MRILTVRKSVKQEIRRAIRDGYVCQLFNPNLFWPDFNEIHQRTYDGLLRTIKDKPLPEGVMEDYKIIGKDIEPPDKEHWRIIFKKIEGYKQGNVVTNLKLVGIHLFDRVGNYSIGGYYLLRSGIMYYLNYCTVKWIYEQRGNLLKGFDYLNYCGFYSRRDGLQFYKIKNGYLPYNMVFEEKN